MLPQPLCWKHISLCVRHHTHSHCLSAAPTHPKQPPFKHANRERKNVNLPGVVVDLPTLTEKDIDDIVNWGVANEIDLIAASFVRKGRDLDEIREVLGDKGR